MGIIFQKWQDRLQLLHELSIFLSQTHGTTVRPSPALAVFLSPAESPKSQQKENV